MVLPRGHELFQDTTIRNSSLGALWKTLVVIGNLRHREVSGAGFEKEAEAEGDENGAGEAIESFGYASIAEPAAEWADGSDDDGEPDHAFEAVNSGEEQAEDDDVDVGGNEEREESDVEDADFGIEEVGEEAAEEPAVRGIGGNWVGGGEWVGSGGVEGWIWRGGAAEEKFGAEENEVAGAGEAKNVVGERGGFEKFAEADGSGESPGEKAEADAGGSGGGAFGAGESGAAKDEGGVETGSDGEEPRGDEESEEGMGSGHEPQSVA